MSTKTAYNPNADLNRILLEAGASKTVYALVTPETEAAKRSVFGYFLPDQEKYFDMFREAWTGKQDQYHEDFFDEWHRWSKPVVDLDRANFPFYYPCNGASEPIRHLIYKWAAGCSPQRPIHVFEGEYEGYKAIAEAARIGCVEHKRDQWSGILKQVGRDAFNHDLFFISAPSAIDGNVWADFNAFLDYMPENSVVVDCTYVGAVPKNKVGPRFNLNAPSVKAVIFSLSKPFGVYYDRIGGIFMKNEDGGLFGNKWFKNLTSLKLGTTLLKRHDVFEMPDFYGKKQRRAVERVSAALGIPLVPSDVFILATANPNEASDSVMADYLLRAGKLRLCVTPAMATMIGTAQ